MVKHHYFCDLCKIEINANYMFTLHIQYFNKNYDSRLNTVILHICEDCIIYKTLNHLLINLNIFYTTLHKIEIFKSEE